VEDDVKARFEEVDKRIAGVDKRFDDVKWYFGGVTTLFTIGFSVLTLVLSWNYKSEKESLRQTVQDIKADLGKIELPPSVELKTLSGEDLHHHDMIPRFEKNGTGTTFWVVIRFVVRNVGDSPTGQIYYKLYTDNDELRLKHPSTDEAGYKYEDIVDPKNIDVLDIPGKMSRDFYLSFYLPNGRLPNPGSYKTFLKAYYGKGRVSQALVTLAVPANPEVALRNP
jgi:hypothetical protein